MTRHVIPPLPSPRRTSPHLRSSMAPPPGQAFPLTKHCHGKSRVRVGRVWRHAGGLHTFCEFTCEVLLESPMDKAFTAGDNAGMTATDTVKNNTYKVAKALPGPTGADAFAVALAEHFVKTYPLVSGHTAPRLASRRPGSAAHTQRSQNPAACRAVLSAVRLTRCRALRAPGPGHCRGGDCGAEAVGADGGGRAGARPRCAVLRPGWTHSRPASCSRASLHFPTHLHTQATCCAPLKPGLASPWPGEEGRRPPGVASVTGRCSKPHRAGTRGT